MLAKEKKAKTGKNKRIKARWINIRKKNEAKPEERKVSFYDQMKLLAP